MKERPILFSAPMVRAILDGRKTQTRRIVKPQTGGNNRITKGGRTINVRDPKIAELCPHGIPGVGLWVRETARVLAYPTMRTACVRYEADEREALVPWPAARLRPVAPMACVPNGCHREAARIHLEITRVRVERLQEISEEDAKAEGLSAITKDGTLIKYGIADRDGLPGNDDHGWHWQEWERDPRNAYHKLWEQINGAGSWDANPWVWVVDFKRAEAQS